MWYKLNKQEKQAYIIIGVLLAVAFAIVVL